MSKHAKAAKHSSQSVPQAEKIGVEPEAPVEAKPRAHEDAVTARREPVAAPRSQDADPNANKGVTITTESGQPVAHPGSGLR